MSRIVRQTVTQSGEGRRAVGGRPTRDVRIPLHLTAVNGCLERSPNGPTLASVSGNAQSAYQRIQLRTTGGLRGMVGVSARGTPTMIGAKA